MFPRALEGIWGAPVERKAVRVTGVGLAPSELGPV